MAYVNTARTLVSLHALDHNGVNLAIWREVKRDCDQLVSGEPRARARLGAGVDRENVHRSHPHPSISARV